MADRKGKSRPAVKQSSARSRQESTPEVGLLSAPSPPRTRSGGRRGNDLRRSCDGSSPVQITSAGSRTKRTRKAGAGRQSSLSPITNATPPRRRSQVAAPTKLQSVQFTLVKIPPAIEMIPKAKPLKKANITLKKAKRQLIFDDIVPSSMTVTPTARTIKHSKKLLILKELQDRLDGLGSATSPPLPAASRQQPGRGKKTMSPPKKNVTVARLARQLKRELQETSPQITRMSLRNGKVKFAGH